MAKGSQEIRGRSFRFAGVLLLSTTLFGIAAIIDAYLTALLRHRSLDVRYAYWELLGSSLWIVLFPVISFLARRFPVNGATVLRFALIHVFSSITIAVIHFFVQYELGQLLYGLVGCPCVPIPFTNIATTLYKLLWRIPVYFVISTVCHSINYYYRLREEELKAVRLESELTQARLDALKARLQPDFVFHAFSEISMMIGQDIKRASQMIVTLAEHLRNSLNQNVSSPCKPREKRATAIAVPRQGSPVRLSSTILPSVRWQWISFGWLFMGVFFTMRLVLLRSLQGSSVSIFSWIFLLAPWALWGMLTPLLIRFWDRYPLESQGCVRNFGLHAVLGGSIWMLTLACAFVAQDRITGESAGDLLLDTTSVGITSHLVIYWTFIFFLRANRYHSRYLQRELAVSFLEFQITTAHLQALKMQLHPHFLFNALHAVIGLLHENSQAAQKMLHQLSHFLKLVLQDLTVQKVPPAKEMEFLECYLEIQKTRFQDRLHVKMDADGAAMRVEVPNLILQPLVENAIEHGVACKMEPGEILIHASLLENGLKLVVRDNGPGVRGSFEDQAFIKEGVGLSNTRDRLQRMYGEAYRFRAGNHSGGGFQVVIEIPNEHSFSTP